MHTLYKHDVVSIFRSLRVPSSELIDRYNLEILFRKKFGEKLDILPYPEDMSPKIKIGWGFNYCMASPILDRNVTENVLEVPILKEFLARGCKIKFIGRSGKKFQKFHRNLEDFSEEWRKLPAPYKPVATWIKDCLSNYRKKYGMRLPNDVDFVIMNAFPSFFNQNMIFYLTNLHYARRGIPVFLWDPELRTLRTSEHQRPIDKHFRYSGADKVLRHSHFELMTDNAYWLLQIPGKANGYIKGLNPRVRILPFFPPYDLRFGMYQPNPEPKFRTLYVGNDSERRQTFKNFFSPLSKRNGLHLFGGGMSRRTEGYKNFDQYIGNTTMHGPIEQSKVWRAYNMSRTCLSIARQRYYECGWIVHRWFEVVLGGCILLIPSEVRGVEKYMSEHFLVEDVQDLEDRIDYFNDRANWDSIMRAHDWQKKFVLKYFSSERCVDVIMKTIGE